MADKILTQPVTQNQPVTPTPTVDDESMVQQSMLALQQQEMLEQEAYESGDMSQVYAMYGPKSVSYAIDISETQPQAAGSQSIQFSNVFAKLFGTLANVFGKDSQIGSKLYEMAEQLDGMYGQDPNLVTQEALRQNFEQNTTNDNAMSEQMMLNSSGLQESNNNMQRHAYRLVENDEFLDMADAKDKDFTHMTANLRTMELRLGEKAMASLSGADVGSKEKAEIANDYMTIVRGLKVYNDTALSQMEVRYQDDPEKLEQAKQGLSNVMSRAGKQVYGIVGAANRQYDFLSEQDKKELDALQLHGVDAIYSEFVGEKTATPVMNFEQQGSMSFVSSGVESRTAMQQQQVNAMTSITHQERVALAESKFDTVLKNDTLSNQSSLSMSLEC